MSTLKDRVGGFRHACDRALLAVVSSTVLWAGGCVHVVDVGDGSRSVWVLGIARVKVPATLSAGGNQPVAFEITGVGLKMGDVLQLGYFRDFEVRLSKDSDSAVIIVRSQADLENLQRVITKLQQQNLCIVTKG